MRSLASRTGQIASHPAGELLTARGSGESVSVVEESLVTQHRAGRAATASVMMNDDVTGTPGAAPGAVPE